MGLEWIKQADKGVAPSSSLSRNDAFVAEQGKSLRIIRAWVAG
jgi:hypothetical protein